MKRNAPGNHTVYATPKGNWIAWILVLLVGIAIVFLLMNPKNPSPPVNEGPSQESVGEPSPKPSEQAATFPLSSR